jgi:FAD dependent oxidoreductase
VKIQATPRLRPATATQTQRSKYADQLLDTFGTKALLSLQDERIAAAETKFREAVKEEAREKLWDALEALGEGWSVGASLEFKLRGEDGLSQSLKFGLKESEGTELLTSSRQEAGFSVHYNREVLKKDSQGRYARSDLPTVTTQRPRPDDLCRPVSDLFSAGEARGEEAGLIQRSYYRPMDQTESLAGRISQLKGKHSDLLRQLEQSGDILPAEAQMRKTKFGRPVFGVTKNESLKEVSELEQNAFALLTHPQGVADGLYRTMDFYTSPGHLVNKAESLGWEIHKDEAGNNIPVADAVVVGAGPGGLSSAFQLARRGARVVTFESETTGHAFSDAGAKPVHHLRTSGFLSNLVRNGFDYSLGSSGIGYDELEHPASLFPRLEEYGHLAEAGRRGLEGLTGTAVHDIPDYPYGYGGTSEPATRATFFAHLSRVAQTVAEEHENSFLCERSPVSNVSYEDGLYTIETARGHKVKAKNLIMATGLTGKNGEHARKLNLLQQHAAKNPEIFENLSDISKLPEGSEQPMILQERSLGNQAVRQSLAGLPEGSRVAMVGSGESALKGALEMLHLNPELSVDLFVKGPIESAQVQIPPEYFQFSDAILATPDSDQRARAESKRFGTPLTPRSLQAFFELQQTGRARLLELGERFNQKSVSLSTTESSKIAVEVTSANALASLAQSRQRFARTGVQSPEEAPFEYDVVVQAIGYQPPPIEKLDIVKELNLPMEAKDSLFVNTTGAIMHQMHTTIPGLAINGRMIAQDITSKLPSDRVAELKPKELLDVGTIEHTDAQTMADMPFSLESGGLSEFGFNSFYRSLDREDGNSPSGISRLVFTEFDVALRTIYEKDPSERTPAEQETLQRGQALAERMRGLHLPPSDQVDELSRAGKLKDYIDNGPPQDRA